MKFKELKIGSTFQSNGITAVKRSTRTGRISGVGRTFYWGQNESVTLIK